MQGTEPNYGNKPPKDEGFFAVLKKGLGLSDRLYDGSSQSPRSSAFSRPAVPSEKVSTFTGLADQSVPDTKNKKSLPNLAALLLLMAGTIMMAIATPTHQFEAFGVCSLFAVPMTAGLLYRFREPIRAQKRAPGSRRASGFIIWGLGLLLFQIGVIYALNIQLDMAPAQTGNYLVTQKFITHGRHNSINYSAKIIMDSWLPSGFEPRKEESIQVSAVDYQTIAPQSTSLRLTTHPGFLGMAWYNNRYEVINGVDPATIKQVRQYRPLPQQPDLQRLQDPLSQRAENLSAHMLAMFQAASAADDKQTLDHADIALSHIRWEYAYNGLSPNSYAGLLGDLENITARQAPPRSEEADWERQTLIALNANRGVRQQVPAAP